MPTNLSDFLSSNFQGSQGIQGRQGIQGTQGTQGIQGITGTGIQGTQGIQGITGTGTQGIQGITGTGTQGTQGITGTGTQGTQGIQGIAGAGGGSSVTITDETTNATRYIGFTTVTSGTATELRISSTKLTYNPSTGTLFTDGSIEIGATDSGTQKFSLQYNESTDSLDFVYTA
jgi:hypothetical protein